MGATTNARITKLDVDDVTGLDVEALGQLAAMSLTGEDAAGDDVIEAARAELERRGHVVRRRDPAGALVAALAAAQAAFPPIHRGHTAEVRGKDGKAGYTYTYADLGDVLAAVRPVLAAHGLAIVQRTVRQANGVVLLTELKHVDGAELVSEVDLGQSSGNPQQFGGALTYLRRYELVTLLGIAAEEDRDAQDVEPARNGSAPAAEVEAWARPAGRRRVEEMVKALDPIIGAARGLGLATSIRDSLGHVPDVAVGTAVAIAAAVVEELDPLALAAAQDTRAKREAEAAEKAKAEEAQAAAEAPDAPGPSGEEPDAPADVDAGPTDQPREDQPQQDEGPTDRPTEEELAAEEPPPSELEPADGPASGSIPEPELADEVLADVGAAVNRLREAGCTCPQPLVVYKASHGGAAAPLASSDDSCPLVNHGIPF